MLPACPCLFSHTVSIADDMSFVTTLNASRLTASLANHSYCTTSMSRELLPPLKGRFLLSVSQSFFC
jgi:hypothetical protein